MKTKKTKKQLAAALRREAQKIVVALALFGLETLKRQKKGKRS